MSTFAVCDAIKNNDNFRHGKAYSYRENIGLASVIIVVNNNLSLICPISASVVDREQLTLRLVSLSGSSERIAN